MASLSGSKALLPHNPHSNASTLKPETRRISLQPQRRRRAVVRASGFEELAANQVLVSAAAASALAQLAKPFATALSGKGFNWKLVVKSGGMPSSHSATVTAAAAALAFDRGLSDGVFGLSVIFAGIVMYDAQGVRNAVGKQAKVINTMVVSNVPLPQLNEQAGLSTPSPPISIGSELARDPVEAELAFMDNTTTAAAAAAEEEEAETKQQAPSSVATLEGSMKSSNGSYTRSGRFFELAEQLPTMETGEVDIQELGSQDGWRLLPLKESIGHTKLEVLVGGIWGVFITCIFHSIFYTH